MKDTMNTRWLRWCLTAIVVLLAIIAIELSALVGGMDAPATAQETATAAFPDTTRQRLQLLDEQRRTTEELRRIREQLRSGTIKVRTVSTDKEDASETGKRDQRVPAPRQHGPAE